MIMKIDGVTAAQLHKLQTFIDGRYNLYALGKKSCKMYQGTDLSDSDLKKTEEYDWYHPVKLLKTEGKSEGCQARIGLSVETKFNIAFEVEETMGTIQTPRTVIDKVWEALERFPIPQGLEGIT